MPPLDKDALIAAPFVSSLRDHFGIPPAPEMFGAKADGVEDDSDAVQAAIDYAKANQFDVELRGTYNIGTTTIDVPANVSLRSARSATFFYSGAGVALDIVGDSTHGARTMTLPHVIRRHSGAGYDWHNGTDTTSCGVRLKAFHGDKVHVGTIKGFYKGLVLKATEANGEDGNFMLNTIHLGRILNNWHGIEFEWFPACSPDPAAGVNQNTIIGGYIGIDGAWSGKAGTTLINMPDAENNYTTIIGTSIERSPAVEKGLYCDSSNCRFINLRPEGATAGYIQLRTATTTQIADATDSVNTSGKAAGTIVFNTTLGTLKIATGATAASTWVNADGTTAVTPA